MALDREIVQCLHLFVDMIAERKVLSVSLDIGGGVKAGLARTAKGSIKVERTETIRAKFEE